MSFLFVVFGLFGTTWVAAQTPSIVTGVLPLKTWLETQHREAAEKNHEMKEKLMKRLDLLGLTLEEFYSLNYGGISFVPLVLNDAVAKAIGLNFDKFPAVRNRRLLLTEQERYAFMNIKVDESAMISFPDRALRVSDARLEDEEFLNCLGMTLNKNGKTLEVPTDSGTKNVRCKSVDSLFENIN